MEIHQSFLFTIKLRTMLISLFFLLIWNISLFRSSLSSNLHLKLLQYLRLIYFEKEVKNQIDFENISKIMIIINIYHNNINISLWTYIYIERERNFCVRTKVYIYIYIEIFVSELKYLYCGRVILEKRCIY